MSERMTDADVTRHRRTEDIEIDFTCGCDLDDAEHDNDCSSRDLERAIESLRDDHDRARASEDAKDKEIERLKAELVEEQGRVADREAIARDALSRAETTESRLASVLEELARLRAQVATLAGRGEEKS